MIDAALPLSYPLSSEGYIISVVLPATQCNLKCAWCYIEGRKEVDPKLSSLDIQDYCQFIEVAENCAHVSLIAIQGYEPLLDESWPYLQAILELGERLQIPVSIVTNGTLLASKAQTLAKFSTLSNLTVSLDASDANTHDRTRGVTGAFQQSIEGIKTAMHYPSLTKVLTVSSVLQPSKAHYLYDMPALLQTLGIDNWVVNPLLNVGTKNFGKIVAAEHLPQSIAELKKYASNHRVHLIVDDELSRKGNLRFTDDIVIRRLGDANRLLRLAPHGQISQGLSIVQNRINYQWHSKKQSAESIIQQVFC